MNQSRSTPAADCPEGFFWNSGACQAMLDTGTDVIDTNLPAMRTIHVT